MTSIQRLLFLTALVLNASSVLADPIKGIVVSISDGDTLTVLDSQHQSHKIRLAGIDAPEKAQPFGNKAKNSLSAMVFNREVEIIGEKRDRYGRTVGKVMAAELNCNTPVCPKIRDINLMQVMSGMAWHGGIGNMPENSHQRIARTTKPRSSKQSRKELDSGRTKTQYHLGIGAGVNLSCAVVSSSRLRRPNW